MLPGHMSHGRAEEEVGSKLDAKWYAVASSWSPRPFQVSAFRGPVRLQALAGSVPQHCTLGTGRPTGVSYAEAAPVDELASEIKEASQLMHIFSFVGLLTSAGLCFQLGRIG